MTDHIKEFAKTLTPSRARELGCLCCACGKIEGFPLIRLVRERWFKQDEFYPVCDDCKKLSSKVIFRIANFYEHIHDIPITSLRPLAMIHDGGINKRPATPKPGFIKPKPQKPANGHQPVGEFDTISLPDGGTGQSSSVYTGIDTSSQKDIHCQAVFTNPVYRDFEYIDNETKRVIKGKLLVDFGELLSIEFFPNKETANE